MDININSRVGDIVKLNFRTAQVFDKYKIDFCCGGDVSLKEASKNAQVDSNKLYNEINLLVSSSDPESKYIDSLELDELCDYIEKRHHTYVNENLPFLKQKLEKLCNVHAGNHPELYEIRDLFEETSGNLSAHMKKEELILFPRIRKMVNNRKKGAKITNELKDIQNTIDLLENEHTTEGKRFKKISQLTSNFTTPPDGCNTYNVTYKTLNDFEQDLHRHIHIENNILFPKALAFEFNN